MFASLKTFSALFGVLFIAMGIMGFMPTFVTDGKLFNIFEVTPTHNAIHLLTGVIAIFAATKQGYAKAYFIIFGILYAMAAVVGFMQDGDLYIMHSDQAGNIFHVVIAIIFLYIGLLFKSKRV